MRYYRPAKASTSKQPLRLEVEALAGLWRLRGLASLANNAALVSRGTE